jgi:hypothetical protein
LPPAAAEAAADLQAVVTGQPVQHVKGVTPLSVIKASSAVLGSSAISSGGGSSTANTALQECGISVSAAVSNVFKQEQQQQQQQQQQANAPPAVATSAVAAEQHFNFPAETQQQHQQQQQQQPRRSLQAQLVQLERQLKGLSRVSFKAGNWLQMKCASNKYEVITCFSVTKWIHLNWGDDGLMKLFHKFYRWGKPLVLWTSASAGCQ